MNLINIKNYILNFAIVVISLILGLLIINLIFINIANQKNFPRSLVGSLPNMLITFYPETYNDNTLDDYIAILGDSNSLGAGDAYLKNKYNYSFAHYLYKNNKKNYLNFGRGGFGSISAVSNMIKVNNLTKLRNAVINLNKPKSIIFFFYEGNDLADNIVEFKKFTKKDEKISNFVKRRIEFKAKIKNEDKKKNIFPLYIFFENLLDHLTNLIVKIYKSKNISEAKLLIGERIKKLFKNTAIENDNNLQSSKYVNSLKNNNKIKNIKPLQSAAGSLTNDEILTSLKIFFESIKYLKSWSNDAKISIIYIPSPATSYIWNDPITYITRDTTNISDGSVVKTTSRSKNNLKSLFIRNKIDEFAKENKIIFLDTTNNILKKTNNTLLHGPMDWHHLNYEGYKNVSNYIIDNIRSD